MGGWINTTICLIPVILFFRSGHALWAIGALINAIANFSTFRVMYNMDSKASTETAAKLRQLFQERGAMNQETEEFLFRLEKGVQVEVAPDWLTDVNIATFLLGIGLLVFSVVRI